MAELDVEGIKTAKKVLALWFCGTDARKFLPLDGPGLPVSQAEELAIRAAAEPLIRTRYERLRGWLSLLIILMVAAPVTSLVLQARGEVQDPSLAGWVAVTAFSVGGLLMLAAAWRYEMRLFELRDSIALSLRERLGAAYTPSPKKRSGPDMRRLAGWAFAASALFVSWPLVATIWQRLDGSNAGATAMDVLAGAIGGVVLGLLGFVALWVLRLGRVAAAAEDRTD